MVCLYSVLSYTTLGDTTPVSATSLRYWCSESEARLVQVSAGETS